MYMISQTMAISSQGVDKMKLPFFQISHLLFVCKGRRVPTYNRRFLASISIFYNIFIHSKMEVLKLSFQFTQITHK